jgi:hypothetical protein
MKCSGCPVETGLCLGESVSRLCELAQTRPDYRALLAGQRHPEASPPRPMDLNSALARISSCADRGRVLPLGEQPECGCAELTECRKGRGRLAGKVTMGDCLSCVAQLADA